jgi:small subunit ribosomal protein S9
MADDEKPETGPETPQTDAEATPEPQAEEPQPVAETPQTDAAATPEAEAEAPQPDASADSSEPEAGEVVVEGDEILTEEELEDEIEETPRVKPEIPGADLEVDIVRDSDDVYRGESRWLEDEEDDSVEPTEAEEAEPEPIADAAIDLAAGARYTATGKRKTAVARVILKPGTGAYTINGRELNVFFPRHTLQRNIRQPLETVGYDTRMDVVATMHGGGVSSQAGALRHGISRALIEADPNLRSELKRRGFLTRDARVKERKKAGLKKARKRPQFSKR